MWPSLLKVSQQLSTKNVLLRTRPIVVWTQCSFASTAGVPMKCTHTGIMRHQIPYLRQQYSNMSTAGSSYTPPADMLEERYGRKEYNPLKLEVSRPTRYNPIVVNTELNPTPGKPFRIMNYVWAISITCFVVAVVQSFYETRAYYKEHGHRYEQGWDLFHYHHKKATLYD